MDDYTFNPRLLPFQYTNSEADQLTKLAYELLPPSTDMQLPDFWTYSSQDKFNAKFGHLGIVVWSRRNSYHLLLIGGLKIARFWNTEKHMRVEVNDNIANAIKSNITGVHFMKPTAPYTAWVSIRSVAEVKTLMNIIKRTYDV